MGGGGRDVYGNRPWGGLPCVPFESLRKRKMGGGAHKKGSNLFLGPLSVSRPPSPPLPHGSLDPGGRGGSSWSSGGGPPQWDHVEEDPLWRGFGGRSMVGAGALTPETSETGGQELGGGEFDARYVTATKISRNTNLYS